MGETLDTRDLTHYALTHAQTGEEDLARQPDQAPRQHGELAAEG